jgi:hypothetical protein
MLKHVQALVKDCYIEGRPRHHLPAARDPAPTTPSTLKSIFFVVTWQDFMALSDMQIQDIFRVRHIVVTDIPAQEYEWNRKTLTKLGSLKQQREVQGNVPC